MYRILVIEDDATIRENTAWLLEASGYEALTAPDGTEGQRIARKELPDLILCDIMMPGMDGLAVLRGLRDDPATAAIPFIFLTARTERNDLRTAMAAGADDYVTKPFSADDLLAAIVARLSKKASTEGHIEARMDELRSSISHALPHELRTPLTTILGFSKLVLDEAENLDTSTLRGMIEDVYHAGRRLEHTVENFGFFAHLALVATDAAATAELRGRRTARADACVRNAATAVAAEHQRTADLHLALNAGPAAIDEACLRKAASELIGNAFKFSPPGTPVSVRFAQEANALVLEVQDRGRGFHPAHARRVGAFLQFDRTVHEHQGSGLGLAIVRHVAGLFGGTLDLQSAPEQGTAARLTLPLAPAGGDGAAVTPSRALPEPC